MNGVNKAILIGHLGKDPESRKTTSGLTVCRFSLATTEKIKGVEETEWHRIVVFGKLAEICGQYLTKGKPVYIEGRIQTQQWEDKDGNKRTVTEIVASEMRMLGEKAAPKTETPRTPEPPAATGRWQDKADDSDIPF